MVTWKNDSNGNLTDNRTSKRLDSIGYHGVSYAPPTNGCNYSIREAILIVDNLRVQGQKKSITDFILENTLPNCRPAKPRVIFRKSCLYKHFKIYKKTGALPSPMLDGSREGRPPIIPKENIDFLNNTIREHPGHVQVKDELTEQMSTYMKADQQHGNLVVSRPTVGVYNYRATKEVSGICAINERQTVDKNKMRQRAISSVRNCMSHLCMILYSCIEPNPLLRPGHSMNNNSSKLTDGAKLSLKFMKQQYNSVPVSTIHPCQITNIDQHQFWAQSGVSQSKHASSFTGRVASLSLHRENRGKNSIYADNKKSDQRMNDGIRVKFSNGSFASGENHAAVVIFTLNQTCMPSDDLISFKIRGLSINSEVNAKSSDSGFVVFIREGTPAKVFHEFYEKEIVLPACKEVKNEWCIPEMKLTRLFIDSDVPQLKSLLEPANIDEYLKQKYITVRKIGAKITEGGQPQDRSDSYKTHNKVSKTFTMDGRDSPLKLKVTAMIDEESRKNRLMLPAGKRRTIIDVVSCTPHTFYKSFSNEKNIKSYVDCGFIDAGTKTTPDVYAIMESFNIVWQKEKKLWFLSKIPLALDEYAKTGYVPETFFDKHDFAIDKDGRGDDYPLINPSIITCRSCDPYHPQSIARIQEKIEECKRVKLVSFAKLKEKFESITKDNLKCEQAMEKVLKGNAYDALTMDQIEKMKLDHLLAFYFMRTYENICECKGKPSKGTVAKIHDGKKCTSTKGPFLIERVFKCRNKPKILLPPTIPVNEQNVTPPIQITNLIYNDEQYNIEKFNIDSSWLERAYTSIASIRPYQTDDFPKMVKNLDILSEHSFLLAKNLLSRLCPFLSTRIPENEKKLFPPYHWVWKSFSTKLVKISTLMILGRGIPCIEKLKLRKTNESYLRPPSELVAVTNENGVFDGAYLYADMERGEILRSGAAEASFLSRGKQHESASKRKSVANRQSKFYSSYPHEMAESTNPSLQLGSFKDLRQIVGIGIQREMRNEIMDLFDWNNDELEMLQTLSVPNANQQGIDHRKYRHIVYFLESAYALAICPESNLSENPGCEWQLNFSRIINGR